jgi:hypothetical protein
MHILSCRGRWLNRIANLRGCKPPLVRNSIRRVIAPNLLYVTEPGLQKPIDTFVNVTFTKNGGRQF